MITEDYVSYETAKLLKKSGFDSNEISCIKVFKGHTYKIQDTVIDVDEDVTIPTIQLAMKWLREVHHYYIQVMLDSWACGGHMGYYVVILKTDSDYEMMLQDAVDDVFYQTYQQACEAAIKYCLENLI